MSQNEQQYRFFQYKKDGHFNITRPINSLLFMSGLEVGRLRADLVRIVKAGPDIAPNDTESRGLLCRGIYTLQQCIGATLDALPAGQSNTARNRPTPVPPAPGQRRQRSL